MGLFATKGQTLKVKLVVGVSEPESSWRKDLAGKSLPFSILKNIELPIWAN
jgi:hypothetical protein